MSSWLVIGASSFTGKHFCEYLNRLGETVYPVSFRGRWDLIGTHYVVDFAALNVVAQSWAYPADYMRVNVMEHITLWNTIMQNWPRLKYLHVSTPEIYGATHGWIGEDTPYNPSTPYAVSRAAAEMLLKCYHKQHGLPVIFTRACNVYGPGQQLYRLIPKLIVSIKKGIRFPLEGGGSSYRAFLHVEDVCAATYLAATKGEPGEAYHIAPPGLHSTLEIVKRVCQEMEVSVKDVIEEAPERPGKDPEYWLDPFKLNSMGWHAQVGIREGIERTVDWMKKNWAQIRDNPTSYEVRP